MDQLEQDDRREVFVGTRLRFSVSHSNLDAVVRYIENQEEHHRRKTFVEELSALVKVHGLEWHDDETDEAEPVS